MKEYEKMISRREFVKSVSAGALGALAFSALPSGCSSSGRRPNFLFIILDDMLQEECNFLPRGAGKNYTPHIDRLAGEGAVFLNQYTSSPVCTPSRFSCLTGLYAGRARNEHFVNETAKMGQNVVQWNSELVEDDVTVAKALKKAGYRTGFAGKNHVVQARGWQKLPFNADLNDAQVLATLRSNKALVQTAVKGAGFDYAASIYHKNPEATGAEALSVHNMDWITKGALDFIEDQDEGQPFFLYYAATLTHGPHEPERSWNANPLATPDGFLEKALTVQPGRETIPQRLKEAGFAGQSKENLLWLDDSIGALIGKLENKGFLDNTIVFFFNDHGQDAKGTVYQGGVLNPSVVWKAGGWKCGQVSQTKISNIDFTPTILDLAGVDYDPNQFDGHSFAPALNGSRENIHDSMFFEMGFSKAVIRGKYKYIALRYPKFALNWTLKERREVLLKVVEQRKKRKQYVHNYDDPSLPFSHIMLLPGGGAAEASSTGKLPGYYDADQLYDLESDPGELNNIAQDSQYSDVLAEMKKELTIFTGTLAGEFPL